MSRRETRLFEKELRVLLERSLSGQPAEPHLDDEVLIMTAGGELPKDMRARVDAHLVVCPSCLQRITRLRDELRGDEEALAGAALIEPQSESVGRSVLGGWWELHGEPSPRRWLGWAFRISRERRALWRMTGAIAMIVIVILLAWRTGGLEFGIHRPEETDTGATGIVQARGAVVSDSVQSALLDDLTPQRMIDDLARIEAYPTWRAIAHGISLLSGYGVPLDAPVLAFEGTTVHIVRAGDTWQSIAAATLGDEALWPVLVLLNREWVVDRNLVEGGVVRVPQLPQGGESVL